MLPKSGRVEFFQKIFPKMFLLQITYNSGFFPTWAFTLFYAVFFKISLKPKIMKNKNVNQKKRLKLTGLFILIFCGACGLSKHIDFANLMIKRPLEAKNDIWLK